MSTVLMLLTHAYVLPGLMSSHQVSRSPAPAQTYTHTSSRSRPIFAFDDGERKEAVELGKESMLWEKTESLTYKEVITPSDDAATPVPGDIVAIHFTATYLKSSEVLETTGNSPLTFKLGSATEEPLFQEAIAGMKVGGKRRVNLAPGSKWASPTAKKTIQFEIELVGIRTGAGAVLHNLRGVVFNLRIINTVILLSFVPDVLRLLGVTSPDGAAQLNAAFSSNGFGAVDILSGAAGSASVVADAANQWAVQGFQGLL